MDNTEFPKNFPDVGGLKFKEVSENPKYEVFCAFVKDTIKNCTGLFSEFQRYLINKNGSLGRTVYESNPISKQNCSDGD